MNNKLCLYLVLASLFSFNTWAKDLNSAKLDSMVEKARIDLQKEVKANFKDASGLENFTLNLGFTVSKTRLYRSLGLSTDSGRKMNKLDLPGLFVGEKEAYASDLIDKLQIQDIYKAARSVSFDLTYYDSSLSEESIKKIALKVIGNQIPTLMADQVTFKLELDTEVNTFSNTVEGKLDNIAQSLDKPLEVEFSKSGFSKIFSDMDTPQVILSVFAITATLGIFVWIFLRIGNFIKEKDFNINVQGGSKSSPQNIQKKSYSNSESKGVEFKDYISSLKVLQDILENEKELKQELFLIASTTQDFELLTILFDTIGKEHKMQMMTNMPDIAREKFKAYIANDAINTYKDNEHLKQRCIKVIKLLKVSAMDPDQFYTIVFNDFCSSLPEYLLGDFLRSASSREASYMTSLIEPSLVSYFISQEMLNHEDVFASEKVSFSKGEIVELLIKVSTFVGNKNYISNDNRLHQVFAFLPGSFDSKVAHELGIDESMTLESLYFTYKEKAKEFFDTLEFNDLVALAGTLTPVVFDDYKTYLPDLLKETLEAETFNVSHVGIELKGKLYLFLKSYDSECKLQSKEDFVEAA